MARIREFHKHESGSASVHPTEVDCGYKVVTSDDGSRLLQLSTFGSDGRKSQPKVSQTIQLDSIMAKALLQIIREVFGD